MRNSIGIYDIRIQKCKELHKKYGQNVSGLFPEVAKNGSKSENS